MQAELELMAYLDGELEGEALESLEARLREEPELRARLDALLQVVELSSELAAERVAAAPELPASFWERLEAVDAERRGGLAPVVPLASRAGWWKAGTALAAAAAALLAVWGVARSPGPVESTSGTGQAPSAPLHSVPTRGPVPEEEAGAGVAIESVDFGSHAGTIFVVSEDAEEPTLVVWLDEDSPRTSL